MLGARRKTISSVLETERFTARTAERSLDSSVRGGPLNRGRTASLGADGLQSRALALRGYGNWALEEKATGDYAGWAGLLVARGFPGDAKSAGAIVPPSAAAATRRKRLGAHDLIAYETSDGRRRSA